ncbi:unnamed protein product [Arctia plantaginis]|uniref:HAT C-terminal dimerisation domain-containing protein n=1 Tax=Arctia plantaginis TaxID=874455 RepID=A0A8S1AEI7_ARCPL|nr:unnamed protein product [Arctia plantaginis]CAB3247415.1 unnamed protein product [Arctia plantaginis]
MCRSPLIVNPMPNRPNSYRTAPANAGRRVAASETKTKLDIFCRRVRFEEIVKAGSNRGKTKRRTHSENDNINDDDSTSSSNPTPVKRIIQQGRQLSIGESFGIAATGSGVPQAKVDKCIVNLFVLNMIPLHVVESKSFGALIIQFQEELWVEDALRQEAAENSKDRDSLSGGGSNASNNDDDEEDFFNSVTQSIEKPKNSNSLKSKAQSLVKMWLDMKSKDSFNDAAFLGEQIFINLFIKYNTAIPSSAAVERLFSTGKDILTPKRASLSDENFNMLMFMKGNMHLMPDD